MTVIHIKRRGGGEERKEGREGGSKERRMKGGREEGRNIFPFRELFSKENSICCPSVEERKHGSSCTDASLP